MTSSCRIKVSEGELQGVKCTSVGGREYVSFLGVPYAEPPVGDLRFKAPIHKKIWSGVLDATKEKDCAPQLDMFDRKLIGDEDCLYLNIHTPSLPEDKEDGSSLPVMVFLHGGAFLFMSGSSDWFSPDFIIESDVILVSINFRLGVLGFLCLDTEEVPGNAGLKDQLLALKWIKANIGYFNGDPDNITVFGISSGAVSIECHLLSPLSEGLFHKAILQSGSSLNPWSIKRSIKNSVEKLMKNLNITDEDPHEIYKSLKEMDAEQIVSAAFKIPGESEFRNGDMFTFTPVIEKKFSNNTAFLDEEPLQLMRRENLVQIPTITGFCSNEGFLFKTRMPENLLKELFDGKYGNLIPNHYTVDEQFKKRLNETYNDGDKNKNVDNFLSDMHFVSGIYESTILRSKQNKNSYFYKFSYNGGLNFLKAVFKMSNTEGAVHGDESTYLSMSKYVDESLASEEDKIMRQRMVKIWTDFAKYGDPTPETTSLITTKWTPVDCDDFSLLNISKDMRMIPVPYLERIQLWRNINNK